MGSRLRGGRTWLLHYSGFWLLGALIAIAIVGPFVTPYDPVHANPADALLTPSTEHWFGTNAYGADVFTRVVHAARLDLIIATISVLVSFFIGSGLGALVGFSRSWWSNLVLRILEFVQSFPVFIIALALVAVSGPTTENVILVIGVLNVPIFARLVRSEVLGLREKAFVEAGRATGSSTVRLTLKYILPNSMVSAVAQASVSVGFALLLTAGLSFIGAGLQSPTPEWGVMIAEGAGYTVSGQWWMVIFPGLALGLAVLGFAMAGDAIGRMLDPRLAR